MYFSIILKKNGVVCNFFKHSLHFDVKIWYIWMMKALSKISIIKISNTESPWSSVSLQYQVFLMVPNYLGYWRKFNFPGKSRWPRLISALYSEPENSISNTVRYLFSPEPLLDFCMHYMHDYHASPHFHRFLLFYLAKIGENGG